MKLDNPLFSIIIPVYNAQKTIAQTIDSVINQTYTNWELIIVNDGSTDQSESICLSIAKTNRNIFVYSQLNAGVSNARNNGLKKAKGSYVIFLDSDDLLDNQILEKYFYHIKPSNKLNYCSLVKLIDENSTLIQSQLKGITHQNQVVNFLKGYSTCPSGYLYNREFLISNNITFNEALFNTADKEFVLKCLNNGAIHLIHDAIMYYRVSISSMSNSLSSKLVQDYLNFINEVKKLNIADENNLKSRVLYICGGISIKLKHYSKAVLFFLKSLYLSPSTFIARVNESFS